MLNSSPEHVDYVKSYLNDLIAAFMNVDFDKTSFLTGYEADNLRAQCWKVIKKLMYDMA